MPTLDDILKRFAPQTEREIVRAERAIARFFRPKKDPHIAWIQSRVEVERESEIMRDLLQNYTPMIERPFAPIVEDVMDRPQRELGKVSMVSSVSWTSLFDFTANSPNAAGSWFWVDWSNKAFLDDTSSGSLRYPENANSGLGVVGSDITKYRGYLFVANCKLNSDGSGGSITPYVFGRPDTERRSPGISYAPGYAGNPACSIRSDLAIAVRQADLTGPIGVDSGLVTGMFAPVLTFALNNTNGWTNDPIRVRLWGIA